MGGPLADGPHVLLRRLPGAAADHRPHGHLDRADAAAAPGRLHGSHRRTRAGHLRSGHHASGRHPRSRSPATPFPQARMDPVALSLLGTLSAADQRRHGEQLPARGRRDGGSGPVQPAARPRVRRRRAIMSFGAADAVRARRFIPVTPLPDGSGVTTGTLGPQDTTSWSFASALPAGVLGHAVQRAAGRRHAAHVWPHGRVSSHGPASATWACRASRPPRSSRTRCRRSSSPATSSSAHPPTPPPTSARASPRSPTRSRG